HDIVDLGHLRGVWWLDGTHGVFDLPDIGPGESSTVPLPPAVQGTGLLTVAAALVADTSWAPAGHEVAWAQRGAPVAPAAPRAMAAPETEGRSIHLGPAIIDAVSGRLALGGLDLAGPELVLWRAPTDNDLGAAHAAPSSGHDLDRPEAA